MAARCIWVELWEEAAYDAEDHKVSGAWLTIIKNKFAAFIILEYPPFDFFTERSHCCFELWSEGTQVRVLGHLRCEGVDDVFAHIRDYGIAQPLLLSVSGVEVTGHACEVSDNGLALSQAVIEVFARVNPDRQRSL